MYESKKGRIEIRFRFSTRQIRAAIGSLAPMRIPLPVPEIAIDTHRTVRLCRLQPILRITIGSMPRSRRCSSPLPLLPEYDYTPRVILPLYAICLPHTLPYVSLVNISSNHPPPPPPPYFILSYSCRKESRCIAFTSSPPLPPPRINCSTVNKTG